MTSDELTLADYLAVLRRRWLIVAAVMAVVVGLAAWYSFRSPEQYRASAEVVVETTSSATVTADLPTNAPWDEFRVIETEVSVINGGLVADAVDERIKPSDASYSYSASGDDSSNVITVTGIAGDPDDAALVANTAVEAYIDVRAAQTVADFEEKAEVLEEAIQSLEERIADLDADDTARAALESQRDLYLQARERLAVGADLLGGTRPRIITQASAPGAPFSPQPVRNIVLGTIVGLLLGVGAALLRETLDTKVRNRDDLAAATNLPVVAEIPYHPKWKDTPSLLSAADTKDRPLIESYRTLATALRFIISVDGAKVIQVTSAAPGEGKTTTIANLAMAMAEAGERVVLVDADLRKPRIDSIFGRPPAQGLTNVLAGAANVVDVLHRPDPELPLVVLGAGSPAPNPAELLASRACKELMAELAQAADVVLVDSPPVLAVADPRMLADKVDMYLLVARADVARKKQLAGVLELLHQVNGTVCGTVLTGIEAANSGYGYYGAYGDEPPKPVRSKPPEPPRSEGAGDDARERTNVEALFPAGSGAPTVPLAKKRQA
jgi:capsular exopolysaccharide synthesis family protein